MPWFGPPMSPTSMATARFMETWAHALDVYDTLGERPAITDRIKHVAHLAQLRAELGFDELRWAVLAAAPIPPETLAFFASIGIPIAELWGMSELSCFATAVPPDQHRLGTVGKLLPGGGPRSRRAPRLTLRYHHVASCFMQLRRSSGFRFALEIGSLEVLWKRMSPTARPSRTTPNIVGQRPPRALRA
jgi:acyl-CoA synthetase (AMP-forming)/AMP-acid ligase II